MKLSCKKKFGWIHVRGGRILRAIKTHAVQTKTRSAVADHWEESKWSKKKPRFLNNETRVFCAPEDLAIEMIAVKTGKVMGYSYLSGDAIQLNTYGRCEWIGTEEVPATLLTFPSPSEADYETKEAQKEFINEVVGLLMKYKYGEHEVVGVEYQGQNRVDAEGAANHFMELIGYEDTRKPTYNTHFIGGFFYAKKKSGILIHSQPPRDAGDFCVTSFQSELVLGSVRP